MQTIKHFKHSYIYSYIHFIYFKNYLIRINISFTPWKLKHIVSYYNLFIFIHWKKSVFNKKKHYWFKFFFSFSETFFQQKKLQKKTTTMTENYPYRKTSYPGIKFGHIWNVSHTPPKLIRQILWQRKKPTLQLMVLAANAPLCFLSSIRQHRWRIVSFSRCISVPKW